MNRRYINEGPDMSQQFSTEGYSDSVIDGFISALPQHTQKCQQAIKRLQMAVANIKNMQQRMAQSKQNQQMNQQMNQAIANRTPRVQTPQAPQAGMLPPSMMTPAGVAPAQAPQPATQQVKLNNNRQQWAFEGRNGRNTVNEATSITPTNKGYYSQQNINKRQQANKALQKEYNASAGLGDENDVATVNNLPQYFQAVKQMSQQVYQIELFIGQLKKQGLL